MSVLTKEGLAAKRTQAQNCSYIMNLDHNDIQRLRRHGNPLMRHVGDLLVPMAERYRRNEVNTVKDAQTVNDVLTIASVDEIRKAVAVANHR